MRGRSLALAVMLATAVAPVRGEPTVEPWQKLLADDGEPLDSFGSGAAVDGDTVLIAAQQDDDNGLDSGSAYVFTRKNRVWMRQAKLLADDGAAGAYFGSSVSLDGDTALIGADGDGDNGFLSGSAYVFTREHGVWRQQAKLLPSDGEALDFFGTAVALSGDTALIGASGDDDNGSASGAAYVFLRENGVWTQRAKLLPDDGAASDGFGRSVALDGDTALISAPGDDDSGAAYVFVRAGGGWTQQAKLLQDDGGINDHFGGDLWGVALDGDTALVAANWDGDNGFQSGSAYVFTRENGVWAQQAKLLPDDGSPRDYFGSAVSLEGDIALIAAVFDDDNGTDSGSTYLFVRDRGSWAQQAKLLADDGASYDFFGRAALDRGTAVIVAPGDDDHGESSGSAHVFRILRDPLDRLVALGDRVRSLDLDDGIETSLLAKLDAALRILTDLVEGNDPAAGNSLGAFVHQVEAQSGKTIEAADADGLIGAAQEIVEALLAR